MLSREPLPLFHLCRGMNTKMGHIVASVMFKKDPNVKFSNKQLIFTRKRKNTHRYAKDSKNQKTKT